MGRPFFGLGAGGFLHPYALLKQRLFFGKECPKDEDLFSKFLDLDNKSRMWQKHSKIHKLFVFTGCHLLPNLAQVLLWRIARHLPHKIEEKKRRKTLILDAWGKWDFQLCILYFSFRSVNLNLFGLALWMAVHWELQPKKSFWYFIIPSPRLPRELKWAQPTLETAGTSTFLAYEWICVHSVAIRKFLTTIPLDMLIEHSDVGIWSCAHNPHNNTLDLPIHHSDVGICMKRPVGYHELVVGQKAFFSIFCCRHCSSSS